MNSLPAREAVVLLALALWPWVFGGACLFYLVHLAWGQQAFDPRPLAAVCAYNSSPPTATSGTFILVQCDSTGKLAVH